MPPRLPNDVLFAGATLVAGAVFASACSYACHCRSPEGFGVGGFCMVWLFAIAGTGMSFREATIIYRLVNIWAFLIQITMYEKIKMK